MKFALKDLEQLSDMVANFKQQPTVLKATGGLDRYGEKEIA